jgi:hypothetical protein
MHNRIALCLPLPAEDASALPLGYFLDERRFAVVTFECAPSGGLGTALTSPTTCTRIAAARRGRFDALASSS